MENILLDEQGKKTVLKAGTKVEVTIEATPDPKLTDGEIASFPIPRMRLGARDQLSVYIR
jgi:hypothetical protein